ncbi:MAG TPA: hypothetical protein VJO12_08220 [Stellaceae bacterium]|nr:hypothetical protein [Stellaceae bacterium]
MSDATLIVREIKVRATNAPLKRPLRNAMGVIPSAPLVLIDVVTEQGITGCARISSLTPLRRSRPWRGSSRRSLATSRARQSYPSSGSATSTGVSACWDGRVSSAWRSPASTWHSGTRWAMRQAGGW